MKSRVQPLRIQIQLPVDSLEERDFGWLMRAAGRRDSDKQIGDLGALFVRDRRELAPKTCQRDWAQFQPSKVGAQPAALVFAYAVCIGNHSFERQPLGRLQASVGFADENAESNGQKRATIMRRSGLQGFRWAFKFKEKYRVVVGAE